MTQELIERLRDRRGSIPIGCDKDGEVVFGDDHDALKAADALQSQSARIAELEGENALMRQAVDAAIIHKMETHTHGGLTEFGEGGLAALKSIEREFLSLTKDSTSG